MVSTRAQVNKTAIMSYYDSDVSDNEETPIDNEESQSSHATSMSYVDASNDESDASSDSESDTECKNTVVITSVESDDEYDSADDSDYVYESDSSESDDEFVELCNLHSQLKAWKEEYNISYEDILMMHSLLMLRQ